MQDSVTINLPEDTAAVILDLDNCLAEGRVAEGIGARYLKRQLLRGRVDHVIKGILGARRVGKILESSAQDREARGLQEFMKTLGETGIATRKQMCQYAKERIANHEIPGARKFVAQFRDLGIRAYIMTLGLDVSAEAAGEYFGIRRENCYGNPVIEKDGIVTGCGLEIKNGEGKLRKARALRIPVEKSVVIGNDYLDWPLMEEAVYSIASPLADEETRGRATLAVTDYRNLQLKIRKL